jgi:hypothetical protein
LSDSSEFWADKDDWPGNPPGYVFLARAVDEVGRNLLPEEWTGDEPLKYEDREWDRGPYKDEAARGRFKKVIEAVSTLCAKGQLASAVMTSSRGTLSQIDKAWWAAASRKVTEGWFLLCSINLKDPVTKVPDLFDREPLGPLFVLRADLDRYLDISANSGGSSIYHTAAAEQSCRRWLEAEMRESPDHRPKAQASFRIDALGRFSGLSRRGFDRAWSWAITTSGANAWRAAGRPKKNPRT